MVFLQQLDSLILYNNNLSGIVPFTVCNEGFYMDIGYNNFCSPYPTQCMNVQDILTQDTSDCP